MISKRYGLSRLLVYGIDYGWCLQVERLWLAAERGAGGEFAKVDNVVIQAAAALHEVALGSGNSFVIVDRIDVVVGGKSKQWVL